ncbi:hypothetical protein BGX33_007925 [Mortierella sp. NVP41]|nr:hypothetical protein BGX33_007925 [Mortierella sp. NVP41]
MPSRTPFSFSPSSSSSASASSSAASSFTPYSSFPSLPRDALNTSNTREATDAGLEGRQQAQQSDGIGGQGGPHLPLQDGSSNILSSRRVTDSNNNTHRDTSDNTANSRDFLAIQLDELTIDSIRLNTQSATIPSSASHANSGVSNEESAPVPVPGVAAQRIGLAHVNQDRDRDRAQVLGNDLDSERSSRSTSSALLLAQPLSLALVEDQSQPHFLSSDPALTPLRRLRASTPLRLDHAQDYPAYAHDHSHHQAPFDYTNNNTGEYASNTNATALSDSDTNIGSSIGHEVSINGHILEPIHSYQSSVFTSMELHQPYPSDTRLALSQVLTSFQGAIIEQSFDRYPLQTAASLSAGSNSAQAIDPMSTFAEDVRPSTAPSHLLTSSEVPILTDESLSLSTDNLPAFPRAALPRRRYATRDYSTGSISSDDWLHHPDVVAFNTQNTTRDSSESAGFATLSGSTSIAAETPFAPTELRLHPLPVSQVGQEETPVQRDREADGILSRAAVSMAADSLSSAAAEAIISSTLTDPTNFQSESEAIALPTEVASQVTQSESTLSTPLDSTRPDRLDLLGPLLSGTQNAPLPPPPSDETLGFSLLNSSSRRIQGFDSSILSMASRIRQARLARILRLMSERETPMVYPDRYQWGRFAPADNRSMVNHASISRGTSRAGSSVEENQTDQNLESDPRDIAEDGRPSMRYRDATSSSRPLPAHYPAFTEVLDCNGNPLDSSNESYASSSASSLTSHDALDDRDEDMDWVGVNERRRRRRTGWDDPGWNRGMFRGQGRSRVVSTGTAFEGLEYISQADNLLNGNDRYRSLKSSWMTNPNGESWSDDESDNPQRRQQGQDHDDKDPENIFMRREPPSLGMLPPHGESGSAGGLYYIYGNVRNRYGPDSIRRRRVMSDMTVLLRREQEWERELEQYDREMAEFQLGNFFNNPNNPNNPTNQGTRDDESVPRISVAASNPDSSTTTLGSSVATAGADQRRASSNDGSISGAAASSGIGGSGGGDSGPNLAQSNGSFSSLWPRSGADLATESSFRPAQELRDYEQGHSHYHTQSEMVNEQGRRRYNGQRQDQSRIGPQRQQLPQHHHHHHHQQPQQQQRQQPQSQFITHQPAVMNRTPPLLPAQPLLNEPIAHQIRRAHNSHMMGLQRRWEMQQQQQQQQQQIQLQMQLQQQQQQRQHSDQANLDRSQRYPSTTFVAPPSRQQPQNHPSQSLLTTSSTGSSLHVAVPMSRGSRSSFRTSHETNGFQHFDLTGNDMPLHPPSSQHPFLAPPALSASGSTLTTVPLSSSSSSASMDEFTRILGLNSTNQPDSSSGVAGGVEVLGAASGSASASTFQPTVSGVGSLISASLPGTTTSSEATSSSSDTPEQQQQQQQQSLQQQQFYRRTRWRGSNTLYVNYEGGTLKPEEQWRRGDEERVGR